MNKDEVTVYDFTKVMIEVSFDNYRETGDVYPRDLEYPEGSWYQHGGFSQTGCHRNINP